MAEFPKPLQHGQADGDEARVSAAAGFFAATPPLQLIAELLTELRARALPFWSPEVLRAEWSAVDRMRWLEGRPDVRQMTTNALTGLVAKAARKKTADFQGALIDSAIDDGDITVGDFEEAFDPRDVVVYGPAAEIWRFFRKQMPWDDNAPAHQELLAWLLKALVSDKSTLDGAGRKPIMTPWELRTAISGKVWQTYMPIEIRIAIDDSRLKMERSQPGVPFQVIHELGIATPKVVTGNIPLAELRGVLDVAERAFGLDPSAAQAARSHDVAPAKAPAAVAAAKAAPIAAVAEAPSSPTRIVARPGATAPAAAARTAVPPTLKTPPPMPVAQKGGAVLTAEPAWDEQGDPFADEVPQTQPVKR